MTARENSGKKLVGAGGGQDKKVIVSRFFQLLKEGILGRNF